MAGVFTLLDCLELGSYTEMIFPLIRSVLLFLVLFELFDMHGDGGVVAWRCAFLPHVRSCSDGPLLPRLRLGSQHCFSFHVPKHSLTDKNIIRIIRQLNMRYEDWDILLFYGDGEQRKPLREFRPQCNTISETEESLRGKPVSSTTLDIY